MRLSYLPRCKPQYASKCIVNHFLLAAVSVASVGFQATAWAQSTVLEEVVVTARKREESLQETPIAITAFSGSQLEEAGIRNLSDLNEVVPNISVSDGSGSAGVANIYIRGVGQRNTEPNLDSAVATYIDGVYVGRADGALLDVNDLQSVQVLRGPQGTLFGKNATGGAMVFTTNKPGPEYEGGLTLRAGNYNQQDVQGFLNVPLVDDRLYTRLSVVSKQQDGYVRNITDGNDYNDVDRISGIWQLRLIASDSITIDFNANYGDTDQRTRLGKCKVVPESIDRAWQTKLSNIGVVASYNKDIISFCEDSEQLDKYEATSDLGGRYKAENKGFSTTIDWELNDTVSLKSITAWRSTIASQNDDLDALSIPLLHRTNDGHPFAEDRETDQYSQELQLIGDSFDGRLAWATGVYGFSEETDNSITANLVGPMQYLPPNDDQYFYNTFATELGVDNKAASAFAQADFSITDNWIFTAGLRYTYEKRKLDKSLYAVNAPLGVVDPTGLATPPAVVSGIFEAFYTLSEPGSLNENHAYIPDPNLPPESASVSDSAWTPLISLKYLIEEGDFINGGSTYITFSQGYRSGGLSEAPREPLSNGGFGPSIQEFEPEEVNNYEIGLKIDTWDNRLRINASAFHMQYDDRQLTTVVFDIENGLPAGATINAAESTISGLELETTLLPIDGLEITFNATWNHGEIDEYDDIQVLGILPGDDPVDPVNPGDPDPNPLCTAQSVSGVTDDITVCKIDRSDENLPRLPESLYMLAIQYTWETEFGTIVPRVQGSWKYDEDGCFDRSSCESGLWYIDKQTNISARITWLSPDMNWRVSAFGTNLTEEDYSTGGIALVDALGYGGQTYAKPRMVGAELQYTF